jgi:membrane-associated phospholipid phosphatase
MVLEGFRRNVENKEFGQVIELVLFFQLVLYSFYGVFGLWSVPMAVLATAILYLVRHKEILKDPRAKKFFMFLKDRKPDQHIEKYVNALVLIYAVFLLFSLVMNGVFLLPEQMVFFGLVGAMYLGKGKKFIKDWVPFVLLILAYEAMRGFADKIGSNVHYLEMIRADEFMFGVVPNIYLQHMFYVLGHVMWYDVLATAIYMFHFSAPLVLVYIFWCEGNEKLFKHISATIVLTSYAGLVFFLLFPAAPPWLAAEKGYLPAVSKVLQSVMDIWNVRVLWTLYVLINPNPVASMPSLHAAYPWIVFLYVRRRWKTNLLIIFPIAMALSLVYLGEHYVIDILAGFLLATLVYLFVDWVFKRRKDASG